MLIPESDKHKVAREIAQRHLATDESVREVYLLGALDDEDEHSPIRLLEVVEGTLEGDTDPIGFAPNAGRGVKYPFQIVEISPREYEQLSDNQLMVLSKAVGIGERLAWR